MWMKQARLAETFLTKPSQSSPNGVLSSDANLDKVAEADLAVIRKTLGVQRLHAAELGLHRLSDLVDTLLVLQKKHRIRFDIWQVVKRDHAIISFFDQVFVRE